MSENYHWVCRLCSVGREAKTLGYPTAYGVYRRCGECQKVLPLDGQGASYVLKPGRVGDVELAHALAQYRGDKVKVHHTLPCMTVTGCGVSTAKLEDTYAAHASGSSESYSYDLSRTTCEVCRKACAESPKDVQQQTADMAWLRAQGETFASLRALVDEINYSEGRLCGDDSPFKSKTRVEFVRMVCSDLNRSQSELAKIWQRAAAGGDLRNDAAAELRRVPAGGLCHDDAHKLIGSVRFAVDKLRDGQAWPDDARRVAADLETVVDALVGVRKETVVQTYALCAGGCGTILADSATSGGLCSGCMKGADILRRNARLR